MKILKQLTISLITLVLTLSIGLGGYTIYAAEKAPDYFTFKKATTFSTAQSAYHDGMNRFFNDKLTAMFKIMEKDKKYYKNKDFIAPPEGKTCAEANVSSYCVSLKALSIYSAYVDTLESLSGKLPFGELPEGATQIDAINTLSTTSERMNEEVENAKRVLVAASATYDEFRIAYPVHQYFEVIINSLNKYMIALKKVRQGVATFPSKFVDATSDQCE